MLAEDKLHQLDEKCMALVDALNSVNMYLHMYPDDEDMKALLEVIARWEVCTKIAKEKFTASLLPNHSFKCSSQPMAGPDSVRPNQDDWTGGAPTHYKDIMSPIKRVSSFPCFTPNLPHKNAMPEPRRIPPAPFANYRIWDNTSEKTRQQIHTIALEFIDIRKENDDALKYIIKKMGLTSLMELSPHRYNDFVSELNKYEKEQ